VLAQKISEGFVSEFLKVLHPIFGEQIEGIPCLLTRAAIKKMDQKMASQLEIADQLVFAFTESEPPRTVR
jgi:hypothetical protein